MPITSNFNPENIRRQFDRFLKEVEKEQIRLLQRLGEQCVTHARLIPASVGFTDQTGNLRASIGYVIFKDGQALHANYEKPHGRGSGGGEDIESEGGDSGGVLVGHEGGGSVGAAVGIALAKKVALEFPVGLILVVTAGMNYAAALESRGRDVLASAEILAQREFPRMIKDLIADIRNA